jgi:hypothetical protein
MTIEITNIEDMKRDLTEIEDREKKTLELSKLKSLVAYNLFWRVEAAKGATFPEHTRESMAIVAVGLKMIASADPLTMWDLEELPNVFGFSDTVAEVDEKITRLYEDRGY